LGVPEIAGWRTEGLRLSLIDINDSPDGHREVLALFDKALNE
jgi:hypothetical protein